MKKRTLSITVVIVALISFVGGFCAPFLTQAAIPSKNAKYMHVVKQSDMQIMRGLGAHGKMMPCCDNQEKKVAEIAIASNGINEKINFQIFDKIQNKDVEVEFEKKPINLISLTSPPGGGLVSSTIKKE